ncbi:MAG: sigma-70 family RNA polymerase sigma factor [Bacteroides sp.]|nr:sigma-70 family RNA polymerase sigma factor [Bacteroides sp.]
MSNEQLTSVFTRLRRQLLGTARTLLTERETAEDVLQDAFVRLWGRTESHEMDDGQMAALASTTVRNLCIDRLRQEKNRETVFDEFTMAQAHQLADDEESNREELLSAVERLVTQELTPLQQRLFQRREVDGASYALLAREEGMEETAIRMQLSRARKKIRNIYLHQNQSSV